MLFRAVYIAREPKIFIRLLYNFFMNRSLPFKIAILALSLMLIWMLSACEPSPQLAAAATGTALGPATRTPLPTRTPTPGFVSDQILLQFDFEPTSSTPELTYPFGRVPPFTLLAGGEVFYADESRDMQIMHVQLSPGEAEALHEQAFELGFADLRSYLDYCQTNAQGENVCISDAAYAIMRAKMPDGSLREVKSYANFSNNPQVFDAVYSLMNNFTHENAEAYVPAQASLFIRALTDAPGENLPKWPLDEHYLEGPYDSHAQMTAWVLEGEYLETFLKAVEINSFTGSFEHEGKYYAVTLVPWLPGVDFSRDIENAFPTDM